MNLILYEAKAQGLACEPCSVDAVDFPGGQTACALYGMETINLTIGTSSMSSNLTSVVFAGLTSVYGQKILVKGTLVIDSDITFNYCRFRMDEGSAISTASNRDFKDNSSIYYACEKMWKGIRINQNAQLFNTYISDAQYALNLQSTGTILSVGVTYDRCYVGIKNGSGINSVTFLPFNDNTFSCNNPLNAPYTNQSPSPGIITRAGMELNNCTTTIGNPNLPHNTFTNLIWGIKAITSNLTIYRCSFIDMEQELNLTGSGVGIHASAGCHILANGYGQSFQDAELAGIYANASWLEVQNCNFTGKQYYGVYSENNTSGQTIYVHDNDFILNYINTIIGIYVVRSKAPIASSAAVKLSHNIFTITQSITYGIFVEALYKALDICTIDLNEMTFSGLGEGNGIVIKGAYAAGFKVNENIIDYTGASPSGFDGILFLKLGNKGNHEISNNTITGDSNYGLTTAINVDYTQGGTDICSNTVDYTETGVEFWGDCTPMWFTSNHINNHFDGIYLRNQTVPVSSGNIDPQLRTENNWLDNMHYINFGATCTATIPSDSKFEVVGMALPYWPPSIFPPNIGLTPWFNNFGGLPNACDTEIPPFLVAPSLSEDEEALTNGMIIGFEDTELTRWELNNALFRKLRKYSELVNYSDMVYSFYNDINASNIGQLQHFEDLALDAFDSSQYDEVAGLSSQINVALMSILDWENQLSVPGEDDWDYEIDPDYMAFRETTLQNINAWQEEINELSAIMQAERLEKLEAAQAYLESIEINSDLAKKTKEILEIRLQVYKEIPLTEEERQSLYQLASLPVDHYGQIMLLAVAMLPLCEQSRYKSRSTENNNADSERNIAANEISVYPNPTSQELFIHAVQPGPIWLMNSTGQKVKEQTISTGEAIIRWDVSDLNPGFYYISQYKANGQLSSGKIIIISGN